ncbi:MAG: sensor histidine kinase [Candidatus Promineifilaceae bacterium]
MVVVIGVAVTLLGMRLIISWLAPSQIRPILATVSPTLETDLINTFNRLFSIAVGLAALSAAAVGALASIILWRVLVIPLREMAVASQRIINGRYDERIPIPHQAGEALQHLARNFNEMATTLARVEENRTVMIGNVAHELRTPLAGVRGIIEAMEDGIYAPEPKVFSQLTGELDRLSRLVNDLQHLSRVEAGAIQLDFRDFIMCDLVQQVLSHLQAQAQAKGVALTVNEADPLMSVYGDSDRAAQILTNLVSNAIRYTPAGGLISVRLSPDDKMARVEVVDTGIGISAENLPHLFERFYRVDQSRSKQSGGSGVGLTISRHLAWALGGELTASSTGEGHGSTFILLLPLSETRQESYVNTIHQTER